MCSTGPCTLDPVSTDSTHSQTHGQNRCSWLYHYIQAVNKHNHKVSDRVWSILLMGKCSLPYLLVSNPLCATGVFSNHACWPLIRFFSGASGMLLLAYVSCGFSKEFPFDDVAGFLSFSLVFNFFQSVEYFLVYMQVEHFSQVQAIKIHICRIWQYF